MSPESDSLAGARVRSYVARQPIFDTAMRVWGYELLFRDGIANCFPATGRDEASSKVIAHGTLIDDLARLTGDKRAFVNVTREVLDNGWIRLLPSDRTVVELLETIEPDDGLIEMCAELRRDGYLVALDDYDGAVGKRALESSADVLKIDFLTTTTEQRRELAERLRGGPRLLAEKLETEAMVEEARQLGFTLFQGFFFARPAIVSSADVPPAKLNLLALMAEIQRPDLDIDDIEPIVKRDMALCYKLLRYMNSALFGFRQEMRSVQRALLYLGLTEARRWATLVAMTMLGNDRPVAVEQALIRARFYQALAPRFDQADEAENLFLLGMFSMLDVVLGRPLDELLAGIPVSDDVRRALLEGTGPLAAVHGFAGRYERGDWADAPDDDDEAEAAVAGLYVEAVEWAGTNMRIDG